jgi:hypothetical protein
MSPSELRRQLEAVAQRLGVSVRFEVFEAGPGRRGGLCRLKGEPRIVVDAHGSVLEQIATLEGALRKLDLEGVFVPPFLRARLEGQRRPLGPALKKTRKSSPSS